MTALKEALAAIVGEKRIENGDALGSRDPGFDPANTTGAVAVFPTSQDEVSQIVAHCAERRVPVVPQGGLTGLAGGAAGSEDAVLLNLTRMNRIERLDPLAATAIVEPGVTLQALENAANAHGLSVGVDLAARGSATIGGMIATNAGGMEAFRNGTFRRCVLGVEAVLANGSLMGGLSEVPKCNEGYDLTQLLCGSEGTLGVVTRAAIKLVPQVAVGDAALIAVDSAAEALAILRAMQAAPGIEPLRAEIMWRRYARTVAEHLGSLETLAFADAPAYFLLELAEATEDDVLDALGSAGVERAILAKNDRERQSFWRIREDSFVVDQSVPHCLWFDISVPLDKIDAVVAGAEARLKAVDPDVGIWVMGHLGDGNLHYTLGTGRPMDAATKNAMTDALYEGLKEIGGAFSAEHGIGTDKRESLAARADPERLRLMREIKRVFDPAGILNPGKVL